MKICKRCAIEKDISLFYRHAAMADGHLSFCKDCTKERVRKHRSENDHVRHAENRKYRIRQDVKDRISLTAKRWREKYPDRYRAQTALNNAVRSGKVLKQPCSVCGSAVRVHGHHEDYSKPLDVVWLCPMHHSRHHNRHD